MVALAEYSGMIYHCIDDDDDDNNDNGDDGDND